MHLILLAARALIVQGGDDEIGGAPRLADPLEVALQVGLVGFGGKIERLAQDELASHEVELLGVVLLAAQD